MFIPEADGRLRPLAIDAVEDKILQRAVVEVLDAIDGRRIHHRKAPRAPDFARKPPPISGVVRSESGAVPRRRRRWQLDCVPCTAEAAAELSRSTGCLATQRARKAIG